MGPAGLRGYWAVCRPVTPPIGVGVPAGGWGQLDEGVAFTLVSGHSAVFVTGHSPWTQRIVW